jgi:hypothetical protein
VWNDARTTPVDIYAARYRSRAILIRRHPDREWGISDIALMGRTIRLSDAEWERRGKRVFRRAAC